LNHYDAVKSATAQSESAQKRRLDTKQFRRNFTTWFYALLISLLPFLIIFFLFTGPQTKFDFLELFSDNALYYICVTMSALSLYTYGMEGLLKGFHIIIMIMGMAIYVVSTTGISIPLFDVYGFDRRLFIAWFFLISIVLGLVTLVDSCMKRGE